MPIDPLPPSDAKTPPGVAAGTETATVAIPSSVVPSGVAPGLAPGLDRADIQPLTVPAALGILVAEARSALGLPPQNGPVQNAAQAAIGLVGIFLASLPPGLAEPLDANIALERSSPPNQAEVTDAGVVLAWNAALERMQGRLTASMEQATATVSTWRDADPVVMRAVDESRAMVLLAVGDKPLDGLLARPEWFWLAPRLEAFRRRRRVMRRRLQDPDYQTPSAEDEWSVTGQ